MPNSGERKIAHLNSMAVNIFRFLTTWVEEMDSTSVGGEAISVVSTQAREPR